jgi:ABC-type antimicrobial peptide transport system permease subunit
MPSRDMSLVVRARGATDSFPNAIRAAVLTVDPEQAVSNIRGMADLLSAAVARPRSNAQLLGVFAVVALGLAAVGIYSVLAYSVSHRRQEIGIRIALGATAKDVLRLIVGHGARLVLIGMGVGAVAALGVTRLIRGLLYGVSPSDPVTFLGVIVLLGLVAVSACYLPARRATRVNPVVALRQD